MQLPAVFTAFAMLLADPLGARELHVFDNGLRDVTELEDKAALLARLGYAGIGWRPGQTAEMLAALERHGLKMASSYVTLHADMDSCPVPPDVVAEIDALKGRGTIVWLAVNGKSNDAVVVPAVREISEVAMRNGLKVAIYPHVGFYTDTMDSALRIMRKAQRPNIGISFNLCHFLKQNDEARLEAKLREAAPHLMLVSVNGADSGDTRAMGWDKLIRPLGEGAFDNSKLLRLLDGVGFKGPVVLQCYNIKQPAAAHLAKSMAGWRRIAGGD
ncbi:MAG: sugar phosphate isomerase/epimerase family protein [Luteolibacter sp.]